jgi:rare lipoprotein A
MGAMRRQILGLTVAALTLPSLAHADIEPARDPGGAPFTAGAASTDPDKAAVRNDAWHQSAAKARPVKKGSLPHKPAAGQTGLASWYGGSRQGHRTASGETLDNSAFTAAHQTLPLHSRARVTNLANGRSVMVRITDRGPHKQGRIIDLSQSAAEQLGMKHKGLARVRVEPMSPHLVNAAG